MKKLTAILVGLGTLAAITVAAQPAQAATLWHCAGIPYAYTCTRTNSAVHVLDRATGQTVTWAAGTSVGLMYYTWNFSPAYCGTGGDQYVWSVSWKKSDGSAHWGVIGDTWLDDGAPSYWGNQIADAYGRTFNPYYYISPANYTGNQGYCNDAYWAFLGGRI